MRRLVALALACPLLVDAQVSAPTWMRYPAISPDGQTIAFTFMGDLYRVPTAGGPAIPLTTHVAHDFRPVWSHDGRSIAFASDRYGNFDIYLVQATGGEPKRLTFHSAPEFPYAFSADDRHVLFGAARMDASANRQYPNASQPELWQVPAGGGRPMQLLTTPAEEVAVSRDGRRILYQDRKGGENAWRKHHTSAIARDVWLYDVAAGTHTQVTTFAGEDRDPRFAANDQEVVYLSEEGGTFNVFRRPLAGTGRAQQLTRFSGQPVRFLTQANDGTLAFGHDGQLYTMKPGGQPQRVSVGISADARANREKVLQVTGQARDLAVSPNGKEVAFIYRGDVFAAGVDGGGTKRITATPEAEQGVRFAPDGKSLVYASEREGRWAIFEARRARDGEPYFYAATRIVEMPLIANTRQNYQPLFSPDGKELAYIEDRNTLRVYNRATQQTRTLLTDKQLFSTNPSHHFEWSPDGQYLTFDYSVPGIAPGEVGLVRADGSGEVRNLTESGFNDGGATWILGGQALMWQSNRDGLKAVAQTGGSQSDMYAMFLTQDAWDRFRLTKDEYALVKEAEDKAPKPKADSAAPVVRVTLDLERAAARKARLTIHSSSLGDALVSKDGETLYYLARFERGMNLWSTNLRTRETKQLMALNANGGSMQWDAEKKAIFLLADGAIAKIDPASARRDAVALNGELLLDAVAEREYMFDHVWRKTRDTFYTNGYHGVDWAAMRPMFARYLPNIANNHEFAEMLSEMLGELNVSHSGATAAESKPEDDATGSLGIFADLAHTGVGVKVDEVVNEGPLDKAGLNIRAGTVIESIDGTPIGESVDFNQLLNRKAGKNVLLGLREGATTREVVVKPVSLGEEGRLLYTRWVRRNQLEVEQASGGKLGYIHIPGMNDGAYRTTFEEVMGKYAGRDGIVVDTRHNGGGDLVADLAMFLSGQKFFDYTTDTRSSGFEPNFRWTKPSVALANEANYSDGHCFAYAYKDLKIGPLVGMPVPGTCTFAGWEGLQDGLRWGVPGLGVKDAKTGKYLENLQTEPDVKVRNEAALVAKGRDQQLQAAIAQLLRVIQ